MNLRFFLSSGTLLLSWQVVSWSTSASTFYILLQFHSQRPPCEHHVSGNENPGQQRLGHHVERLRGRGKTRSWKGFVRHNVSRAMHRYCFLLSEVCCSGVRGKHFFLYVFLFLCSLFTFCTSRSFDGKRRSTPVEVTISEDQWELFILSEQSHVKNICLRPMPDS